MDYYEIPVVVCIFFQTPLRPCSNTYSSERQMDLQHLTGYRDMADMNFSCY